MSGIEGFIQEIKRSTVGGRSCVELKVIIPEPSYPMRPEIRDYEKDQEWAIKRREQYDRERDLYAVTYDNVYSLTLEDISIYPHRELKQPQGVKK